MATDTYQEGNTMSANNTLADFPFGFGGGIRVRAIGTGALFAVERYDVDGTVVYSDDAFTDSGQAMRHALDRAGWLTAVEVRETGCVDDGTRRYLVSAYDHHVKPAQYLELRIVAWNTTAEIDR